MNDNTQLFYSQDDKAPAIYYGDNIRKQLVNARRKNDSNDVPDEKKITLFILGMVERIDFQDKPTVILGRFDNPLSSVEQIDLSDYGAVERGVSRKHCQLRFEDGQLMVTDLGSSNGTFLSGARLEPHESYTLRKGEELLLGRLPIQIIF